MDAINRYKMTLTMPSDVEFALERAFDAPRELVFRAWTEPKHLSQWYGCVSQLTKCDVDLTVNGGYRYTMGAAGAQPIGTIFGVYREIAAPERLVFVNSFSDAAGGLTRAPFPQLKDLWPLEVLNVMTLTEAGGKTTLMLRGSPINASAEERAVYAAHTDSMRQGFGGTFDQLAGFLAKS